MISQFSPWPGPVSPIERPIARTYFLDKKTPFLYGVRVLGFFPGGGQQFGTGKKTHLGQAKKQLETDIITQKHPNYKLNIQARKQGCLLLSIEKDYLLD